MMLCVDMGHREGGTAEVEVLNISMIVVANKYCWLGLSFC